MVKIKNFQQNIIYFITLLNWAKDVRLYQWQSCLSIRSEGNCWPFIFVLNALEPLSDQWISMSVI